MTHTPSTWFLPEFFSRQSKQRSTESVQGLFSILYTFFRSSSRDFEKMYGILSQKKRACVQFPQNAAKKSRSVPPAAASIIQERFFPEQLS
jgi:hypothetical protein